MRVNFSGQAAMKNVADLKSWGLLWYDIGRGVAMAHNLSPEDVRIVGATRGSIIIELVAVYAVTHTISKIILSALTVAARVLDIRKKAEEVRGLKLNNDKLAAELEKAADEEKDKGIKQLAEELTKALKLKSSEGDKATALEKAIKNLINFTEKGGKIDFVLPKTTTESAEQGDPAKRDKEIKELRDQFEKIRLLEDKLKLLEHHATEQRDN